MTSFASFRKQYLVPVQFLNDPWLIFVLIVFCVLASLNLNEAMLYTPDGARYILWAQSLSKFQGFLDSSGVEIHRYVVHAPFYSLLLAPFMWIALDPVLTAKVVTIGWGVLLLVIIYFWIGRKLGRNAARIGVVLIAWNPLMLLYSTHILSEVPFCVFLLLAFLLLDEILESDTPRIGVHWLLSLMLGLVLFSREIGITMVFAVILFFVVRKEFRRAIILVSIPLILYAFWYIRNEVIVAAIDLPALRNTKLLFEHTFTPQSASLFEEFLARIKNNTQYYVDAIPSLLIFPQYLRKMYPVVAGDEPLIREISSLISYLKYPLWVGQLVVVTLGGLDRRKNEKTLPFLIAFLVAFVGLIVLYPVLDIRFVFPISLFLVFYSLAGARSIWRRWSPAWFTDRFRSIGSALIVTLLLIPNMVWSITAVIQNRTFQLYAGEEFEVRKTPETGGELYLKPFRQVGQWIREHSDTTATVMTRWKEISLWLEGRKIVQVGPATKVEFLDRLIRDYEVKYLLVRSGLGGLRELEFQINHSRKFQFQTVYRAGYLEVLEVLPLGVDGSFERDEVSVGVRILAQEQKSRMGLREGISFLELGAYHEAHARFKRLWEETGGAAVAVVLTGVALGFASQYEGAEGVFKAFYRQPQAGDFLDEVWFHQELLNRQQRIGLQTRSEAPAFSYFALAANYWEAGFRYRTGEMIERALAEDSCYLPALKFGVHYALQIGDTTMAAHYVRTLRCVSPANTVVQQYEHLFETLDSLRRHPKGSKRTEYEFEIAAMYERLGFIDTAIDHLNEILQREPGHIGALRAQAFFFEMKNRRAVAAKKWREILFYEPGSSEALRRLEGLSGE